MKYAPSIYARAFAETKADHKRFLNVVEKNGDFSRINKIIEAIEALMTRERSGRIIQLEFARKTELAKKFKFDAKDHVHISVNPSLVAGMRITVDGERELDQSLQRKLNKLWHTKS